MYNVLWHTAVMLQIFDNAYRKITDCLENDKYSGYGVSIKGVPHDSRDTDVFPDPTYNRNKRILSRKNLDKDPEFAEFFRCLMAHFSSSLYRLEFQRCSKVGCTICPAPLRSSTHSPFGRFLEKCGGTVPTPTPALTDFSGSFCHHTRPGHRHYRVFSDFMKMNIPEHLVAGPDKHYAGSTKLHVCPFCPKNVHHMYKASLAAHVKMIHPDS